MNEKSKQQCRPRHRPARFAFRGSAPAARRRTLHQRHGGAGHGAHRATCARRTRTRASSRSTPPPRSPRPASLGVFTVEDLRARRRRHHRAVAQAQPRRTARRCSGARIRASPRAWCATSAIRSPSSSPKRWRRRRTPPNWSRWTTTRCPVTGPVWDECPDNVSNVFEVGNRAATDAAFARAARVVKRRYAVSRVHAQFLEPRGALGEWDAGAGRYTLHCDVQYPHRVREVLAGAAEGPRAPGARRQPTTSAARSAPRAGRTSSTGIVLWLARKLGRPVKWTCDRSEALLADEHARDVTRRDRTRVRRRPPHPRAARAQHQRARRLRLHRPQPAAELRQPGLARRHVR